MSFHNTRCQQARKQHRCCECGGIIPINEHYDVLVGVYEGDFYHEKQCADCSPVYERLNYESWKKNREGITFGTMYECIDKDVIEFPKYLLTRFKRNASIHPWMIQRYNKLQGTAIKL